MNTLPGLQQKVDVYATRIFVENQTSNSGLLVNRGGARSSKSYSLGQLFWSKFFSEKSKKFLIVRKSLPALRVSTLMMMQEILSEWNLSLRIKFEKQFLNYYYGGNFLHFGSIDDPEKIKSTEWNYIWMEEATEFDYTDYKILKLRLSAPTKDGNKNQMFLSFNPIDEFHWIKERVIDVQSEGAQEIVSTYRDNPFLSQEYIQLLEALIDQDLNFFRIYSEGEWGKLEHLIYSNWEVADQMPPEGKGKVVYGLDFGYSQSHTALIKIVFHEGEIWEKELLYKTGLTNQDLIERLDRLVPRRGSILYADSAEPDRIEEIRRAGWLNCKPAEKSVADGIDMVKRYKTNLFKESQNLIKEKKAYSWRKDKQDNVLDEPVKFMNHLMDAERYAVYTYLKGLKDVRVRWL